MSALPVIAIDGTAASGKGTIARALAARFGFDHLDTGALYRIVGALVLRAGGDPSSRDDALAVIPHFWGADVAEAELRSAATGEAASQVAVIPEVRAALFELQTSFAKAPPGGKGAVLDGRDIGTVICPGAEVKIFVTASVEERARRRWKELVAHGSTKTHEMLIAEIRTRDARDGGRAAAPMKQADDAVMLDTTDLSIDEAVAAAEAVARARLG
ncbi:MAG: (d)CMP kinase [Micropepsaceae bacterium]